MSVVHRLAAHARFTDDSLMARLGRFLDEAGLPEFVQRPGDLIAIKIDVAELGGLSYLRPPLVRAVVEKLMALGADPVLMDTTRLHDTARSVGWDWMQGAEISGYTNAVLGRPLVLGDGPAGSEAELLPVDGDELGGVEIARLITEYAGVVVLSHVTGHPFAGLGGALTGLGIGGCAREGKWRLHAPLVPHVNDNCDGCGRCAGRCLQGAISLVEGRAVIDAERCRGCAYYCVAACPRGALAVSDEQRLAFQKRVVEAASAVHTAAQGRLHFLNFLLDVTPYPDYYPFSDVAIAPDLGVMAATDPVALDQATLDAIEAMTGGAGSLARLTGADAAPMLAYAEQYGLGSRQYELAAGPGQECADGS